MVDYRSDRSESPEGKGLARKAWDGYVRTVTPAIEPVADKKWTADLIGFWVIWHVYGGFEGLQEHYGMHKATIWRKVALFRKAFGEHPDSYRFPGIEIDRAAYWDAARAAASK
jgi:hypothetical protein